MPRVNLYIHTETNSPTTLVWKNYFAEYLPDWELRLKFAERILEDEPDHVLFPGGSGSKFAARLGKQKMNEIIHWVCEGGSYIGVCAGAYLAVSHLHISPLKIPDRAWERGLHDVILEKDSRFIVSNYHNGPIFESHPSVENWAYFKSEYLAEGGYYSMKDTPAITHNKLSHGQVTLFSPHLEKSSDETKSVLATMFEYIDSIK